MKTKESSSRGFVYVASGEQFIWEAVRSATRVKKWHDLPCLLICDRSVEMEALGIFDEVRNELDGFNYKDKILMGESPYEESIFLDTDTLVCEPMWELFDLLDRFDLAVQFSLGGNHYRLSTVPPSFHEPSAGIVVWKKNQRTEEFFRVWKRAYEDIESSLHSIGAWDQRSLRYACYHSDVRIVPVPVEYQFCSYGANLIAERAIMLHGRNVDQAMADYVNSQHGPRVWLPRIGLVPDHTKPCFTRLLAFTFRFWRDYLKRTVRNLLHKTGLWRLPESKRDA